MRTLLTFEQFEQFPDDGMNHELLQGEHIVVPPPKLRHTRIQQNLQDAMRAYVREHTLGEANVEAGFKLGSDNWLQPDVSFVRTAQIEQADPDGYYEGAPAIPIEFASESNTAAQVNGGRGAFRLKVRRTRYFVPRRSIGYEVNRRGFARASNQRPCALQIRSESDGLRTPRIVADNNPHVLPG